MSLEELNKYTKSNKQLLNNLNDFIIQIDYFDQKGIKKRKNKIPLKYRDIIYYFCLKLLNLISLLNLLPK